MRYLAPEILRFLSEESKMVAKLAAEAIDPNLRYFHDRLKPAYSLQVVRTPQKTKSLFESGGIFSIPAAHFLSFI